MNGNPMGALMQAWREDPEYRARMEADSKAALAEKGVALTDATEARIAVNTPDTVMSSSRRRRTGRCPTGRWRESPADKSTRFTTATGISSDGARTEAAFSEELAAPAPRRPPEGRIPPARRRLSRNMRTKEQGT